MIRTERGRGNVHAYLTVFPSLPGGLLLRSDLRPTCILLQAVRPLLPASVILIVPVLAGIWLRSPVVGQDLLQRAALSATKSQSSRSLAQAAPTQKSNRRSAGRSAALLLLAPS